MVTEASAEKGSGAPSQERIAVVNAFNSAFARFQTDTYLLKDRLWRFEDNALFTEDELIRVRGFREVADSFGKLVGATRIDSPLSPSLPAYTYKVHLANRSASNEKYVEVDEHIVVGPLIGHLTREVLAHIDMLGNTDDPSLAARITESLKRPQAELDTLSSHIHWYKEVHMGPDDVYAPSWIESRVAHEAWRISKDPLRASRNPYHRDTRNWHQAIVDLNHRRVLVVPD